MQRKRNAFIGLVLLGMSLVSFTRQVESSQDSLNAVIIAADAPEAFTPWKAPAHREPVVFETISSVYPGQTIYVGFVVGGYGVTITGMSSLGASYLVTNPLGQTLYDEQEFSTHYGFVAYPKEGYLVLEPLIELSFDEEDTPGPYLIQAVVYDRLSGKSVNIKMTITLY